MYNKAGEEIIKEKNKSINIFFIIEVIYPYQENSLEIKHRVPNLKKKYKIPLLYLLTSIHPMVAASQMWPPSIVCHVHTCIGQSTSKEFLEVRALEATLYILRFRKKRFGVN